MGLSNLTQQRLFKLALYLRDRVSDDQFDLDLVRCGTVACAMGHAPLCFPELIRPKPRSDGSLIRHDYFETFEGERWPEPWISGRSYSEAGAWLFEITPLEAEWLFAGESYRRGLWPTTREGAVSRLLAFIYADGIPAKMQRAGALRMGYTGL